MVVSEPIITAYSQVSQQGTCPPTATGITGLSDSGYRNSRTDNLAPSEMISETKGVGN